MESGGFDVFQAVKTLLYLGNYQGCADEANSTDINEEDMSQVVKRLFYQFITCVEDQKGDELNIFLQNLKEVKEDQIKIYYTIFLLYTIYVLRGEFKEERFNKLLNDLKNVNRYDPVIFPAVYIIALMLLDRGDNENFLQLIEKFEKDLEILMLKFYLFFNLNKTDEMEKILNIMGLNEPDSVLTQICSILFNLYKGNDFDLAISTLQQIIKNNSKNTPKLFNFIGIALMSKSQYEEAAKALTVGKDTAEKSGFAAKDLNTILVNLITCYRNLHNFEEVIKHEEILRKNDPKNLYFARLAKFEEEINSL
jgi:tetratricopeptide (TPR) repeat protein